MMVHDWGNFHQAPDSFQEVHGVTWALEGIFFEDKVCQTKTGTDKIGRRRYENRRRPRNMSFDLTLKVNRAIAVDGRCHFVDRRLWFIVRIQKNSLKSVSSKNSTSSTMDRTRSYWKSGPIWIFLHRPVPFEFPFWLNFKRNLDVWRYVFTCSHL